MNAVTANLNPRLREYCTRLLGVALGVVSGLAIAAQNGLTAVSVSQGKNNTQVVKVQFKEALSGEPVTFTTSNPHRLVLDFADTENAVGRSTEKVDTGAVASYQVVGAGGRTRLVINLSGPTQYEIRKDKNTLYAVLSGAKDTAASAAAAEPAFAATAKARSGVSIRDVEFRRGQRGEARVLVSLSDPGVGIDIQQKGKTIQVDFLNVDLPAPLRRRMDVSDFATPAQMVEVFDHEKSTRMVVTPRGKWDYYAYQTGNQFVVEVRPLDDKASDAQGKPVYSGEKLSLNFQNVEVRAVLQVIADFTGLNIVAADTVKGSITTRLKDVPWDQALDIILRAKDLDKRVTGSVIWVAPREELAAKEKMELEAKQQIAQLEELQTEIIHLNYLRSDEAQKMILGLSLTGTPAGEKVSCKTDTSELVLDTSKRTAGVVNDQGGLSGTGGRNTGDQNNSLISPRGSVTYDLKTNSVFIKETPGQIEKIKTLLSHVDVPARQIMIEARVVLAGDSFGRALGARLGLMNRSRIDGTKIGIDGDITGATGSALTAGTPISAGPPSPGVNLNAPSVLGSATSAPSIGISVLNAAANTLLSLELQALEADKRGKIISSPRVITQNQQPAVILQGQRVPNLKINSTTSGQTIEIEYEDALLCLLVDPQVLNNDEIILNVTVNKDTTASPIDLPNGSRLIPIDTKRVRTTVRVKNGDTAVLGGVYEQELRNDTEKVPFLGDIPILGHLFKSNIKEDRKAELLIFLTPRLLHEGGNP